MRQAGRYLPEYNKTRARAGSFMSLCKNPELACEVTLQPIERYGFDAAILFSDILTIPDAMGLELDFVEGHGPKFNNPITDKNDLIRTIQTKIDTKLDYVGSAVKLIRANLNKNTPLIGFAGSPWTLACYVLGGGGSKDDFIQVRKWLYTKPDLLIMLLEKLTENIISYLTMQIKEGADAIMLFDSWGGLLSSLNFPIYSLHYLKKIITSLNQNFPTIPKIVFVKGGGVWLESIVQLDCSGIGVDWTVDLKSAKKIAGNNCAVQGNLDPAVLLGNGSFVKKEVKKLLDSLTEKERKNGYIFNLGHGISQYTPPENVAILVDTIREY
tara:strand:+ start:4382 stop:5359 length:978 start_codon:yes stop_codon:yes gene_type:complete